MKQENPSRQKLYGGLALIVAAVLLAVDQVIKYFVLRDLRPMGSVTVIRGLLELSYLENKGAAFGLFQNSIWLVVGITVTAFVGITAALFRYKKHTFFSYAASVLLIAGGLGNLIDRVLYGFVVDFIHVMFFDYIFNFADCCITVGAVLFVIHVLLTSHWEKEALKASEQPGDPGEQV